MFTLQNIYLSQAENNPHLQQLLGKSDDFGREIFQVVGVVLTAYRVLLQ